jgi:translation elongation factor EF-G
MKMQFTEGPAQVLPAVTRPIYAAILGSDYTLLEPKQKISVSVPQDFMGSVNKVLSGRRTQIEILTWRRFLCCYWKNSC